MMKVFLGLGLFVLAFYSYANCTEVQTQVNPKTKLYRQLNEKTPYLINTRFERSGNIEKVLIIQNCTNKIVVRYQSSGKDLKTNLVAPHKFYCRAELALNTNQILKANCLAPTTSSSHSGSSYSGYEEPNTFPDGEQDDPYAGRGGSGGAGYGDEPEFPSRNNDDGPDGDGGVLF